MLSAIVSGKVDLADALFLIAAILFLIATVYAAMRRAVEQTIGCAGLVCIAVAWLVL